MAAPSPGPGGAPVAEGRPPAPPSPLGPEVELRALRKGEAADAARLIRATLCWERTPAALLMCLRKRAVAIAVLIVLLADVFLLRLAGAGWALATAGGALGAVVAANGWLRSTLFAFRRRSLSAEGSPPTSPGADMADLYGHYVRDGSMFFVAMLGEVMVGCVGVEGKSASTAEIRRMMVMEGCQGHGIGGNLLRRAVEFCRKGGYTKVVLKTSEAQAAAQRVYARHGFQQVGEAPLVTLLPDAAVRALRAVGAVAHPRDWSVSMLYFELDLTADAT